MSVPGVSIREERAARMRGLVGLRDPLLAELEG
jgi:hypothetical protein